MSDNATDNRYNYRSQFIERRKILDVFMLMLKSFNTDEGVNTDAMNAALEVATVLWGAEGRNILTIYLDVENRSNQWSFCHEEVYNLVCRKFAQLESKE